MISLDAYKGKFLLLGFFRYAGCPFCNLTLIELIQRYDNFARRGLETVAFFQSADESIQKYVMTKKPPFPVVADPAKKIYDKFGVESSRMGGLKSLIKAPAVVSSIAQKKVVQGKLDGDGFLMPAQFVIGPDGKIVQAHYGSDFGDKIPMIDIEMLILSIPQKV